MFPILTVTLNPAWDVTYPVDALVPGATHRTGRVAGRAGGKGINVARVLTRMGQPALATGVLGGDAGRAVAADLAAAGVPADFGPGDRAATRTTVTVVETGTGRATLFNEPGPEDGTVDWPRLRARLLALAEGSAVLVLSGSLPPAVPVTAYAELITGARARGVPVILDCDGPALTAALPARPDIVKPNADELARATGTRDLRHGAELLLAAGARAVVVSDGPAGLLALAGRERVQARPPAVAAVNPTGAGDAAVAALAAGLPAGASWEQRLRDAAAWSAASVLEPVAGAVDPDTARRLATQVEVEAGTAERTRAC